MDERSIRIRKLLMKLDDYLNDMCYYDDELETEVWSATEDECYDSIMKDEEMRLLGTKFVKGMIHTMYTDYSTFSAILIQFRAC